MESDSEPGDRLVIVSITVPADLLAAMDSRCESEDLTRSAYLRRLARKDLARSRKFSRQPQTTEAAA